MFKKISNWWNKSKIKERETLESIARIEAMFEEQKKALVETKQQLEETNKQLEETNNQLEAYQVKEEETKQKYASTEPWIEIKSAKHDEVKGIQIELDWNDAFIQYLKENGINGKDEEIAVQKYIGLLYEDLIQRFEQRIVDNSDKPRINDFE